MKFSENVLRSEEKAIYRLRELYSQYGYARYKVSKFEEYDLYAHNKNFLVSENILTFTDTNGRLMALKPDVTLSIVKNVGNDDCQTHKLYYNENVYRTSPDADGFREIVQTGLECIGKIDLYLTCEVLMLAQKSLSVISADHILDLSHMGFVSGLLEFAAIEGADAKEILQAVGNKNTAAVRARCAQLGVAEDVVEDLCRVTALYEPLQSALVGLAPMVRGEKMKEALCELEQISRMMRIYGCDERIYLDFSIINDMNYYNGIMFRGFVNGIPEGILSGGRYDSLLAKMGKRSEAIGFAVYLNLLERFGEQGAAYDVDTVLLYDDSVSVEKVMEAVRVFRTNGRTVRAENGTQTSSRCRQLCRITKGGIEILETND